MVLSMKEHLNENIFLSLENPCAFFAGERKAVKSIFNTDSELSQNHTANRVIPFKTTVNWLFNDLKIYIISGIKFNNEQITRSLNIVAILIKKRLKTNVFVNKTIYSLYIFKKSLSK